MLKIILTGFETNTHVTALRAQPHSMNRTVSAVLLTVQASCRLSCSILQLSKSPTEGRFPWAVYPTEKESVKERNPSMCAQIYFILVVTSKYLLAYAFYWKRFPYCFVSYARNCVYPQYTVAAWKFAVCRYLYLEVSCMQS